MQIVGILVVAVLATAFLTFWLIRTFIFPSPFNPVVLSQREEKVLQGKLDRLAAGSAPGATAERAIPEPYREDDAARTVRFTERELNSLLAKNTDLADRVALDLSDKLVSAKILVPVEEDFPVFGGRTLRISTGLEFDYQDGRPIVKLKGVSLMGVPLPNAWLGGLKNVDLVDQFGRESGFWKIFADGVANIEVKEGELRVRLRE